MITKTLLIHYIIKKKSILLLIESFIKLIIIDFPAKNQLFLNEFSGATVLTCYILNEFTTIQV